MDVETRDTVVVGGGQSGLAMSHHLTERGRDHVVLERSRRIGETWRGRWDSFTLVTPNWLLRLPGHLYEGDDPDGYMPRDDVVDYLEAYARRFDPPMRFGVTVTSVEEGEVGRFRVRTNGGDYEADNVVLAAGTFQHPRVPGSSKRLPAEVDQLHTRDYRNPQSLRAGGVLVVGSGQSGCQITQELHESGRRVHLCVGSAGRLPRRYRGRDGIWWAIQLGMIDRTVDDLDSPDERFAANPQISGRDGGREIDLHQFARDGITLLGRLEDVRDGRAILAPDLHDNLSRIDTMVTEFRKGVDGYVEKAGLDVPEEVVDEPDDGYDQPLIPELDLADEGITTVIWATGFGWDYESWVRFPVFDDRGFPIQQRGVSDRPGLYFVGLHWLHALKSGLFAGVGDDAAHVADHIATRSTARMESA